MLSPAQTAPYSLPPLICSFMVALAMILLAITAATMLAMTLTIPIAVRTGL